MSSGRQNNTKQSHKGYEAQPPDTRSVVGPSLNRAKNHSPSSHMDRWGVRGLRMARQLIEYGRLGYSLESEE